MDYTIIIETDAANFFNALDRDGLHKSVKDIWPAATPFFDRYYGFPSAVSYILTDESGNKTLHFQNVHEDTKQGDSMATAGASIFAECCIYRPFREAFPFLANKDGKYSFDLLAIIDDLTGIAEAPSISTQSVVDNWWRSVEHFLLTYDRLANPYANPFKRPLTSSATTFQTLLS